MKKLSSLVPMILAASIITACIDTSPKELGNKTPSLNPADTSNSSNFLVRFAYRDTTTDVAGVLGSRVVFVQGEANSANAFISTCNASGTSCACDFFTSGSDTVVGTSVGGLAPEITYNSLGNTIICKIPAGITAVTDAARVRIRNTSTELATAITTVSSSPTLSQLLGSLSAQKMRTISRYECTLNYIQNAGVSASPFSFTCSVGPPADLEYIQVDYKYYIFADNLSNNYSSQISDLLYNAGTSICGVMIKQVDCTGSAASNDFGLYSEASGIYQKPISLQPNPNATTSVYGYAAAPITVSAAISATTLCPPGLEKKETYTTTAGAPLAAGTCPTAGTSNNVSALANTWVSTAGLASAGTATVNKVSGGSCAGAPPTCTAPTAVAACDAVSNTYPAAAAPDPYCVIPSSYLP